MPVLGVPDIGIVEPVDIGVELTVVVHIHIDHEENVPPAVFSHRPLSVRRLADGLRVEFYLGHRSPLAAGTNWLFFIMESIFTLSQDISNEILE
ncbi:MAG: hypothetical protein WC268_01605 [Patescibacteria group bacterium]|jgi:hypothetical protein